MNLKWIIIHAIFSFIVGILFAEPLLSFIKSLLPVGVKFIATNPFDGFMLIMWCGLAISIIIFLLGLIILLYKEYQSAFYVAEKIFILKSFAPAVILFIIGAVFGIVLYTQIMLPFFIETNIYFGLENYWNLYSVITSGIGLSLMLGLAFLFPIILRGLIKLGALKKEFLKQQRAAVIIGILVVSAIITPTPDILSQLIVGAPLYVLFELSLL